MANMPPIFDIIERTLLDLHEQDFLLTTCNCSGQLSTEPKWSIRTRSVVKKRKP